MIVNEIYNKLPKFKRLEDLYVIGYTIEVGSNEANKYIKKFDNVQKGIKEIYKNGKDMWKQDLCSKFMIAIFTKDTNQLVASFQPDMDNFNAKSSVEYIADLGKEITEIYNEISKSEDDYNWYKRDETRIKRQINEKCIIAGKQLLFERDYIKQEKQRAFFDVIKAIEKNGQPEYINSIFGNSLIGNNTIIGEKEEIKSYIRLQIAIADEVFDTNLFENEEREKTKYINDWKQILNKLNSQKEDNVMVLKRQDGIFKTIDVNKELQEIKTLLKRIEEKDEIKQEVAEEEETQF